MRGPKRKPCEGRNSMRKRRPLIAGRKQVGWGTAPPAGCLDRAVAGATAYLCIYLLFSTSVFAEDWPQFRGPGGQGHSSERGLPITWSEDENIAWKVPIAGLGWSSPAIQGDRIWLTTALDDGHSLRAICLDRDTGEEIHNVEVFQKDNPGPIQSKNSHASPTPILEGDRVYVHYGAHGTACLTTDGEVVWRRILDYYHRHGPGGSPALAGDLLVINCDGYDAQFVVALDKHTGAIRWKKDREGQQAYCTPLMITVDGKAQAISPGGDAVVAYAPKTGDEIWRVRYDGYSNVPRPVFGHGLLFICSGYNDPVLYAIQPDGNGDVTDTHVVWSLNRGVPLNPSPLLVANELYIVNDSGFARCLDARTGAVHWLHRFGDGFSASPIYADGRIYYLREDGEATVIAPGTTFEKLAVNRLEGRTLASIAVSDGALFLRSDRHLYRIEDKQRASK